MRRGLAEGGEGGTQVVSRCRGLECRGQVLLAQLLSAAVREHRDVRVARGCVAQQLLQQALPGRGIDQVGAAYHVGNALGRIVNDHG
jgi:hypothetical protein